MEIDLNAEEYPPEQLQEGNITIKNGSEWIGIFKEIPAGLFYFDSLAGEMHINPKLLEYLRLGQMPISPVLEEYFWSRLEFLGQDSGLARLSVQTARARLDQEQNSNFRLDLGNGRSLEIRLFKINLENSDEQTYGGFVLDLADDRAVYLRQVKMLQEMGVQARKNNASAKGNLDALADNLRLWSPAVRDEFLADAKNQLQQVNHSLDLMLNLIQVIEGVTVYSDTVNLIGLIKEIIRDEKQEQYRLIERQEQKTILPLSYIDPALTRLALQYLMQEIATSDPKGKPIDISLDIKESDLIIKLERPRTIPLPGLSPGQGETVLEDENIRIFLSKKIIKAQGGSLALLNEIPGSGGVSSIEIRFPSAAVPQITHKFDPPPTGKGSAEGRILVAEAQPENQIQLRDTLQEAGYRVDLALDGSAALDLAQAINPDLVILARNLPGLDGLLVTQGIRRWSAIPIIMVSERTDPGDLLYAYQLGVDDYLRKPVSTPELLVRAQVCLRRSDNARRPLSPDIFQSNMIRIDYSTRQVWIRGNLVDLTPIEYNLLVFMSRQGNQIMPYEQLLSSVWEGPEKGTRQGLFVHVKRLREKIENDPKNPQIINNKWGVGYVFNP